jgi:hypothetical protein
MTKKTTPTSDTSSEENIWDDIVETAPAAPTSKPVKPTPPKAVVKEEMEYDLDGLMTDFPTAKELERFVFDETGIVLNLKGRANKLKYQIAMDALNGVTVDEKFIGNENPYVDKNDMVPVEDLKPAPARDTTLPDPEDLQNLFYSPFVPHTNEEFRSKGKKVHCMFRKYKNNMISYEILGPLDQVPFGTKIDKYGRERPEIIKWVDPRTGEQVIQREDGTLTNVGRRLRSMMQSLAVNNTNQWEVWVDREFAALNQDAISNPWDLS